MDKKKIAPIPGFEATQDLIELILETAESMNNRVITEMLGELPDCEQKKEYVRMAIEKSIANINTLSSDYDWPTDFASLIPDEAQYNETLRTIVDKYLLVGNHVGAFKTLQYCFNDNYRHDELEAITRHFLRQGDLSLAQSVAKTNGRDLSTDELERYVAANLSISLDNVINAINLLKRGLIVNELSKIVTSAYDRGDFDTLRRAAIITPSVRERELFLGYALEGFLSTNDCSGVQQTLDALGRKITANEARKVISLTPEDDTAFLETCINALVTSEPKCDGPVGIILHNEIKQRLKKKEIKAAMTIFFHLPEKAKKLVGFGKEGFKIAADQVSSILEEACASIEKYPLKKKLAQEAAKLVVRNIELLDCIVAFEAALMIASKLSAGDERKAYLEKILVASKKFALANPGEQRFALSRRIAKMIDENNAK